ncbi:hypothetical protein GPROT2_00871 [Gammaproteobacteria bacterium]|nr:hypothetical protein [Gammaproteobacteria bacterium]QOJ33009.1 MAG: hypothetical protein HRU81_13255 [Gammaproteobacteria bacterium]CAG0940251.1 hypothetical protein GPROT2_00871 [Gammaproteobacteria bacterium]
MPPHASPKVALAADDPETDVTDGGWDPYVTSLLASAAGGSAEAGDEADDGAPVMSFSQPPRPQR